MIPYTGFREVQSVDANAGQNLFALWRVTKKHEYDMWLSEDRFWLRSDMEDYWLKN